MDQERIYVVVPVYKVEPYLERCVESILNQTYDNYELILVDDGSPDNCPAICDWYAEKYDHITVIHQENGGLSAARNAGIEYALAKGNPEQDWINFIDSDDFVHPRYLEYLYRAAKEAGTDIGSCSNIRTTASDPDYSGDTVPQYDCISPEAYWTRKFTDATVAWGKVYRLMVFKNIRYPVGKLYEDNYTTYKILFQQEKIAIVWMPLYYWYINSGSITSSVWNPKRLEVLEALEEQLVFFKENGYMDAYTASARELLWHSIRQRMYMNALSPKYDYMKRDLMKKQKRAFGIYAKEVGLVKAERYWFEIRIAGPARRVLKQESVGSFVKRNLKKRFFRSR